MRGSGDFQRMQMTSTDPHVNELFGHLRKAIDLLEQMMLRSPSSSQEADQPGEIKSENRVNTVASESPTPKKLAYGIKEVSELIGISRGTLYGAIQNHELRAVKCEKQNVHLGERP